MGFLNDLFGSKTSEAYTPPTLDQYVSATARQIASMATPNDIGQIAKPEMIVKEIHAGAAMLAKSSGMSEAGGVPLSVEEAMVRTCDDFRGRFGLGKAPEVHYRDGDAAGAGLQVQNPPPPTKSKSFAQRLGF